MELKAKGEGMEGTEREMRAVRCCKLLLEGLVIMLLIYELFFSLPAILAQLNAMF